MNYGENIRNARLRKLVSQNELARRIGVSSSALCYYEKGKRKVKIDLAIKICKALDVPLEEIVRGDVQC